MTDIMVQDFDPLQMIVSLLLDKQRFSVNLTDALLLLRVLDRFIDQEFNEAPK